MTTEALAAKVNPDLNLDPNADADADAEIVADPEAVGTAPDFDAVEVDSLGREIDALSLRQALLDFEMANARVLDLTARLVEANARVVKLQAELDSFTAVASASSLIVTAELDAMRGQLLAATESCAHAEVVASAARSELAAVHASRSFRVARRLSQLMARVRS